MNEPRAVTVISPQGERWLITLTAHGRQCPGGDQHEDHADKPWTCDGTGARRKLTHDEMVRAFLAMGYEVEGATERSCRHCHHDQRAHPDGFVCAIEGCPCAGFFLDRPWKHRREAAA